MHKRIISADRFPKKKVVYQELKLLSLTANLVQSCDVHRVRVLRIRCLLLICRDGIIQAHAETSASVWAKDSQQRWCSDEVERDPVSPLPRSSAAASAATGPLTIFSSACSLCCIASFPLVVALVERALPLTRLPGSDPMWGQPRCLHSLSLRRGGSDSSSSDDSEDSDDSGESSYSRTANVKGTSEVGADDSDDCDSIRESEDEAGIEQEVADLLQSGHQDKVGAVV